MKKIITMAVLIFSSMLTYACTSGTEQKQAETQKTAQDGSVIVMNKAMFIKDIFDYEKSKEWKYKGDKPAIIDLYADWCGQGPHQSAYKSMMAGLSPLYFHSLDFS